MSELPTGWAWTSLGEIGDYLNGRGFKKSEWRESGRPIIRIQNLTGSGDHFNYFDGEPEEHYIARDGDLLVSWAATLGVFVWRGPEAVVNQHIFKVASRIDRQFHRYLLLATLNTLQRETHGSGMVHITKPKFDGTPVAMPPLNEQQRIVAAIEEQFSRLDAADKALASAQRRASALTSPIRQIAVQTGTEQTVGDLLHGIEAGKSFTCYGRPAQPGEWGVIKVSAMTWGSFDAEENKAVLSNERVDSRWEVRAGDLLLSRANTTEYVGASVLVDRTRPRLLLSDKSMRLLVKEDVHRPWLHLALSAPSSRAQMSAVATGTSDSMRNISQEKVKAVRLRVPSLDEQRRIVALIEERLSAVDALRDTVVRSQRRSASLRRAILDRAFSGELVAQDASDEPASTLLDEIRAERSAAPVPRRRRVST